MAQTYMAVRADRSSNDYQQRYVIIDKETGEILDDANGYGYKSKQKAYAAYGGKPVIHPKMLNEQKRDIKSNNG